MKLTIAIASILTSLSSFAVGNIKSATLMCQDDDLRAAHVYVKAELQVVDGNHTMGIDRLTLPLTQEATEIGLGVFTLQDELSWEGNQMASTAWEHVVKYKDNEYKEKSRFGFQEIGKQVIGYIYYETDREEGSYEGLLVCEKVIVTR